MRAEFKYLIPTAQVPALRTRLAPFVLPDPKAMQHPWPEYVVRSIYFDTHSMRYYREKVAGIRNRKKLRIRAYNTPSEDTRAFLEIKRKFDSGIVKDRAALRFADVGRIMYDANLPAYILDADTKPHALEQARHFYFHLHRYGLRPIILVVYNREPYIGRLDRGLRITFDKGLRSAPYPALEELYREQGLAPCFPGYTVVEVKFNGSFPFWLRPLLVQYGLRKQAVSKYVRCINTHGLVAMEPRNRPKRPYHPHQAWHIVRE